MQQFRLDVIVITYNNERSISVCLSSLEKCSYKKKLYAFDNFSEDKTCYIIKKEFPQVKLIKNNKNIGFGVAVNQGAKIAKGDYLLFLNPDTVVKGGCIEEMVRFLEKKKDAAVVGCRVLNPNGSLQPSCGKFPTIANIILDRILIVNKILRTELIRQESFYAKEQTSDWVSGAFFLVKRDVFLKLGGFDEKYFMYVEDVDFCYRARDAGYKIFYNPKAEIIHCNMGKSRPRKRFKAIQMRRGFTIFFKKYKTPIYVFLWKAILHIESLVKPHLRRSLYD